MPCIPLSVVATSSQPSRPGKVSEYQVLTPSKKSPFTSVLTVNSGNCARRRFSRIDSVGRSGRRDDAEGEEHREKGRGEPAAAGADPFVLLP